MTPIRRLEAKDICKGKYHNGVQNCALGWGWEWWDASSPVFIDYLKRLGDVAGLSISVWNDFGATEEVIAKTINGVLEEMGLVEKEAKHA